MQHSMNQIVAVLCAVALICSISATVFAEDTSAIRSADEKVEVFYTALEMAKTLLQVEIKEGLTYGSILRFSCYGFLVGERLYDSLKSIDFVKLIQARQAEALS